MEELEQYSFCGNIMEHLLQDLFKTLNEEAVKEVDAFLNKPSRSRFDFSTVS